jgi:hypothetical protein
MSKVVALLPVGFALVASACSSHPATATVRNGTIEIRQGLSAPSLLEKGVLGVKKGSSAGEVRRVFGAPWLRTSSRFRGNAETCWNYHAHQAGTSIDGLGFCMNKKQRVSRIAVALHL